MASTLRFDGQVVVVTGAGGGEHAKAGGLARPGGRGVGCGGLDAVGSGVRTWSCCCRDTESVVEGEVGPAAVRGEPRTPTRTVRCSPIPPCAAARGPEGCAGGRGAGPRDEVKVPTEPFSAHRGRLFLPSDSRPHSKLRKAAGGQFFASEKCLS